MFLSRIEINDKQAKVMLEGVRKHLLDLSPEMRIISRHSLPLLNQDIQDHFNKEMSPVARWKPSKSAIKEGRKTLTKTGALRNSLKSQIEVDKNGLKIRTQAEGKPSQYANVHNNGMFIRNRSGRFTHMPKRQFAWFSSQVKDRIANDAGRIIARGF